MSDYGNQQVKLEEITAERDALLARVAELEAQLAALAVPKTEEALAP